MGRAGKEIKIGSNRLFIDEDKILHVISIGDIDEEVTREIEKLYQVLMEETGVVRLLIDLNRAGKVSTQARKLFNQMAKDTRILKVASFGLHPVARVIATFGMGAVYRRGFAGFFKTEEEAGTWLKK